MFLLQRYQPAPPSSPSFQQQDGKQIKQHERNDKRSKRCMGLAAPLMDGRYLKVQLIPAYLDDFTVQHRPGLCFDFDPLIQMLPRLITDLHQDISPPRLMTQYTRHLPGECGRLPNIQVISSSRGNGLSFPLGTSLLQLQHAPMGQIQKWDAGKGRQSKESKDKLRRGNPQALEQKAAQ